MKHLHHFGLSEDPFRNEPRLRDFFETTWTRNALARLDRGLRQSRGLMLLTGDLGSGKTMLVRRLLESLEEEVFEASMLVVLSGGADAGWILTRFAKLLGIEEPEAEREALLAQVYEQLAIIREDGRHAVLIIDDAHLLASGDALSDVCGLLKLEYEDRRLFSLVLAGDDALDAAIAADPELAHRVEVRVRMEAFDAEGSAAYLVHRIRQAGGAPAILEPDAISALHRLGRGMPGWINTVADNALFEAFLCGRQQMTRADVECAHRALGWEDPAEASAEQPVEPRASQPAEVTAPQLAQAPASQAAPAAKLEILDPLDSALGELDSELEAVFEVATAERRSPPPPAPSRQIPSDGPPKEEEEPEDLLIELIDD